MYAGWTVDRIAKNYEGKLKRIRARARKDKRMKIV